jgi:hypothetical protein
MTPQRIFYRTAIRALETLTHCRSFHSCRSSRLSIAPLPEANRQCDLITIAFNNVQTLQRQIHFIQKYIRGHYNYIVADNSTDKAASVAIETLCAQHKIAYIRLPKNYLTHTLSGSYSHGAALNWAYRRIIRKRQAHCFGFLDHDLFPIRPIDPTAALQRQPLYGWKIQRGNCWYLWAGFCFFRSSFVQNRKMDFLPAKPHNIYLDTGGGNWYAIYSQLNEITLTTAAYRYELIDKTENRDDHWADNMVEYFDETWLHTMDASNWYHVPTDRLDRKEKHIRKILEKYL